MTMKANVSFYWFPEFGRWEIGSLGDGAQEIVAWLSDDVTTHKSALKWIDRFNGVTSGQVDGYLGTGNAHHVRTIGEKVFLECIYAEEMKVFMTRPQIISALKHYCSFLEDDIKNPHHSPQNFEVEYEIEGEEALELYLKMGGKLGLTEEDIKADTRRIKSQKRGRVKS